ncbi:MAG: LysE family transporter [Coriobacteriia bacterium]|nr:LysE family transporter [Coriobacteriia bacterium]
MPNTLAFLSYVLLTTFTPGPNNIMSMSNASRFGFRKSLRFTSGVFAGFFVLMVLSCAFSLTLYSVLPSIKPFMTVVGAAYILWLAYKTATASPHAEQGLGATNTFLSGALLQFLNPKAILYGITAASTFLVPYYKSPVVLAGFCLFMAGMSFISTSSWAAFGSVFERFLSGNGKAVSWVMAALLVYCAVALFM